MKVLVNNNILGGWKYVNDKTGLFYDENNIRNKVEILLSNLNSYEPRKYFLENHGLKNSGKIFRDWLKSIHPELSECKYVKFPVS